MFDFNKIDETQMAELKQVIQKSVEKSELERYYLFSLNKKEKVKLFLWCYRFLMNAYNLLEVGGLKEEIKRELDELRELYNNINFLADRLEHGRKIGRHIYEQKMFWEINREEVTNLIDIFTILTEKVNIISISRFKGVILEGKSGEEYKKIMSSEETGAE